MAAKKRVVRKPLRPEVGEIRYGFYLPHGRDGELEFLTSTQAHMVLTQDQLLAEIKSFIDDYKHTDCDDTIVIEDIVVMEMKRIKLDFPKSWPKQVEPGGDDDEDDEEEEY